MARSWDGSSPVFGVTCLVAAAICLTAGTASLDDATSGWQHTLTVLASTRPGLWCLHRFTIPGWGADFVLGCTLLDLGLLGVTELAVWRMRRWGAMSALFATVLMAALWVDTFAASGAPGPDCDSVGMTGAASVAIVRAGWFLVGGIVSCGLAGAWLNSRWRGRSAPVRC